MPTAEITPRTLYIPTQRCHHCGSARTTMQLIPGTKTHQNHEPPGINKWTCSNCHTQFNPSEIPLPTPVLICTNCKDMTIHHFVKNEEIQHIAPPIDQEPQSKPDSTDVHHHVISHMHACNTCGTVRVYGCHIGVA